MAITFEQLLWFDFTNYIKYSKKKKRFSPLKLMVLPPATLTRNEIATQHYVKQHFPHST